MNFLYNIHVMQKEDNTSGGSFLDFIKAIIALFGAGDAEVQTVSHEAQSEEPRRVGMIGLLGNSFGGVSLSTSSDVPENTSGSYQLYAQMTGTEKTPEGYNVAVGNLILVAPDGSKQIFDFNSGAGRNLQNNMLPGLCADINGSREGNATFDINNDSLKVDSRALSAGMLGDDGRGEWLQLISDRSQTSRGGTENSTSGFFGIHTDGNRTGTAGCLGMSEEQSEAFFNAIQQIPKHLRPNQLVVLSPKTSERTADLNLGSGLPTGLLGGRLNTPRSLQ